MKKIVFKLALFLIFVAACNTASAEYSDEPTLQLLMHCDETNHPNSWLLSPDDNSSGRALNQPVLDRSATEWAVDTNTIPTLTAGSPKGGNYLHFNGVDDTIYVSPGWASGNDNIICDFSMRWLGYPPTNNPYAALIQTKAWRSFLRPAESNTCRVSFLFGSTWLNSTNYLASNTWYDIHFYYKNGTATLIIEDITNTASISFTDQDSQITIGNDIYRGDDRYFYGDIDEVRIGSEPIPPPRYSDSLLLQLLLLRFL